MKRQLPALVAAFLVTAFVALTMGVMSVNALFNQNGVPVANNPVGRTAVVSPEQAQIQQIQVRINEYQTQGNAEKPCKNLCVAPRLAVKPGFA